MLSPGVRSTVAIVACLAILLFINLSIAGKERHLATGRLACLELAPVDPRSMMQGDYMALNYSLANDVMQVLTRAADPERSRMPEHAAADGRIVATLDDRSVATFARLEDSSPPGENEIYLAYRVRNGRMKFASNAFFFQEGTAGQYEGARYGCFRVNNAGELLLASLHDENLIKLGVSTE